eukprot:snap_masked-scaffold_6-processed-gene-2.31-mRNA-1 protein AED:1.00 eAED:1.00 QI:0/0/0/0/1/1/2/0/73
MKCVVYLWKSYLLLIKILWRLPSVFPIEKSRQTQTEDLCALKARISCDQTSDQTQFLDELILVRLVIMTSSNE